MPSELVSQLLVTYARQHRHTRPTRRSQAEPPLPWHEGASTALRAIAAGEAGAIAAGWALLDRGDPPLCVGPCRCGELLYAPADTARGGTLECGRCGRQVDVDATRRTLLAACEGALVDYTTASRALPLLLGAELSTSTLRTWVQRGHVQVQAWQLRGHVLPAPLPGARPLLRLGDLLDRIAGTTG